MQFHVGKFISCHAHLMRSRDIPFPGFFNQTLLSSTLSSTSAWLSPRHQRVRLPSVRSRSPCPVRIEVREGVSGGRKLPSELAGERDDLMGLPCSLWASDLCQSSRLCCTPRSARALHTQGPLLPLMLDLYFRKFKQRKPL